MYTTYAVVSDGSSGLRNELHGTPIKMTVLYPGYIASEMNGHASHRPRLMVGPPPSCCSRPAEGVGSARAGGFI